MTSKKKYLNYFSDKERDKQAKFSDFLMKFWKPLLKILTLSNIKPDHISYFGVSLLIPFSIFFQSRPIISAILLIIYVFNDGIDGALARYQQRDSNSGAFTDIVCDQLGLVVIVFNLIYYDFAVNWVAYIYGILYIIMIAFSVVQNALDVKVQLLVRTKYTVYLLYIFWAFKGFDRLTIPFSKYEITPTEYFTYPLILFSIIMIITNLISYFRLKNKLATM